MNNTIFNKLSPKETKFFPLLDEFADSISIVSTMITECVTNYEYNTAVEIFKKIKEQERRGDKLIAEVFDKLNTTFITPFDREDIHDLANTLDDVLDNINNSAKRIVMYHPNKVPESAAKLSNILLEGANILTKAIKMLATLKKDADVLKELCNQLHTFENEADDIYESFIIDLFENEKDAIEIIKLKEIMHELEDAADTMEKAGKIIKTIIVKYA
jgi:predicted phosphate transport protein (TIGR00153 family)